MQGFKKARKGADDVADVAAAADPVVSEPAEPKTSPLTAAQPLWLAQTRDATDLSAFAPKIVVVGVGGAGGNAGVCVCVNIGRLEEGEGAADVWFGRRRHQ